MGESIRHPGRARRRRALWGTLGLLLAGGCSAPSESGPPGAWWVGRGPALHALLAQLARLDGTPLAAEARRFEQELPECEILGAHVPDGDARSLIDAEPRCIDADSPLAAARHDAELAFALPIGDGPALRGTLRDEGGRLAIDLRWPAARADGPLALLLPGEEPVGTSHLADAERMLHLQVRPRDGIDLAALVPEGGQADRLFKLRSAAFSQAALDGSWEAAVYVPEREGGMPDLVLALGSRLQRAARAGAERLISDLQQTWPVERTPLEVEGREGACLLELNVLPELAPCYLLGENALLIGWNPRSIERALAAPTAQTGTAGAAARLDLDLTLMRRADEVLAAGIAAEQRPRTLRWPWRRLRAAARSASDTLEVRVTLDPESEAASS